MNLFFQTLAYHEAKTILEKVFISPDSKDV